MSRSPRSVASAVALLGTVLAAGVPVLVVALPAHAATVSVEVRDFDYVPEAIEIVAGDTVRWTWRGESRHSVTAPGVFDSHPRCTGLTPDACGGPGDTFSWTSSQPGTIEYGCKLHPDRMRGSITVVAASEPSPSPTAPPAEPSPSPSPSPAASPAPPPQEPPPPASSPSPDPPPAASSPPATSPSPSPRPTRRSAPSLGFGEATEVAPSPAPTGDGAEVAPPVVSDASPEPLEPFPAAPSPTVGDDPVEDDVVAVGDPGGSGRDAVRLAGAAAVALSLLVFGRVVLFGRSWE